MVAALQLSKSTVNTHRGNYRMTTAYILLKKTSIRKEKQTCETAPHQNTQRNQTTDKDTRRSSKNHPTHPQPGLLGTHHPRCRPWGRPGAWLRGTWRRRAAPGCGPGSRSSSAPRWPELPAECWRGEDRGIKDELQPRGGVSVKIQVAQCETLKALKMERNISHGMFFTFKTKYLEIPAVILQPICLNAAE